MQEMLAPLTHPRRRILLALWNRRYRLSGCHLGTKLPCSPQPDGQKLPLKYTSRGLRLQDTQVDLD